MRLIATLLFVLVAGCATEQTAYQQQQRAEQYRERLAAQCSDFGFTPGTPDFSNCMMQLHQAGEQRRAAIGAALIGSGMLKPVQAYQIPMPKQPTRTNCYTDNLGYTRCTTQ